MAPAASDPTQTLISGETQFAFDLYNKIKSNDGNLFFSPYSISTCLGMTYVGARGNTAKQMAKVLHFDVKPEELPTPMGVLEKQLNEIRQGGQVELNTANGLWGQSGYRFRQAFLQACEQDFGARVEQVNFRRDAKTTRQNINDWVADQTKHKITDLIAPGTLDATTALVLVNAIYFKGTWQAPFGKGETSDAMFTTQSGQIVQARLMSQTSEFQYGETDELQLLEMNYKGESELLSMVILLPKNTNGLARLEKSLTASKLEKWLSQTTHEKVHVFVPRFKMTREFELDRTLAAMGMAAAFSPQADFSGMDGTRNLFISAVVHKAFVDVNEEGTEAAAATYVEGGRGIHKPRPVSVFRADHPFIFLIRHTRSGSILFLGRVTDPTK